ncbi:MAG TPA: acyl-CoA dehydrogenase [Thermoanaerobaculia bacterium]|nr:acyl-CoA dehydrogenase [Thermoanaerobaculia bacterium]HUM28610.1 acyl-CoA dehydrogenase [Thermoanaerobaculia bacterium]HXK66782.1 acyl-CoA dehydrogenase [Thermoanaerobaculia bacterium]
MSPTIDEGRPLTVLTEEEQMFFDMVKDFADNEIRPLVSKMDEESHLDRALLSKLFEAGLMGIDVPEKFGGSDGTFFMSILAIEALSQVDPGVAVLVDVQNTLVNNAIRRWGTEEQQAKYFPRLTSEIVGAYALSEAGSGSDAFALRCKAEDKGDHFLLNGQKLWITNAGEADLFIIFATMDMNLGYKGITAFLVERGFEGFSVGKKEDKLGIRASSTCELVMENCRVPRENLLGEVGKGYKVAIETLNEGRIGIGSQMLGLAEGALGYTLAYTAERKQFNQALNAFQGVQFELARMHTDIESARLHVYNAARLKDAGLSFVLEAAVAKLVASEVAERVASEAVNLYGGYGFTREYPVEKFYRDSKIGQIYEGTSNMQLQTIAKAIIPK